MNLQVPSLPRKAFSNSKFLHSQCSPLKQVRPHNKQTDPVSINFNENKYQPSEASPPKSVSNHQMPMAISSFHILNDDDDQNISFKLQSLKELWKDQPILQRIKTLLQGFRPPLPYQFEKAIIFYCSVEQIQHETFLRGTIMNAARIFKAIQSTRNYELCILQFSNEQNFFSILPPEQMKERENNNPRKMLITSEQQTILIYNILNMLLKCGMIKKFFALYSKLISYQKIKDKIDQMAANAIILQNSETKEMKIKTNKQVEGLVLRDKKIKDLSSFLKQVTKTESCTKYEAYNIGLIHKKAEKYNIAAKIFKKIKQIHTKNPEKIHFLAAVNYAKCLFSMNMRQKAIKELKSLLEKNYMKPFQRQLSEKLTLWTQTHKLYLITNTFKIPPQKNNTFRKSANLFWELPNIKQMRTAETECTNRMMNETFIVNEQNKIEWAKPSKDVLFLAKQDENLKRLMGVKNLERKSLNTFERSTQIYNRDCKKHKFEYRLTKTRKNTKKSSTLSKTTKQKVDPINSKIDIHEIPAIRLNYRSKFGNNLIVASEVQNALQKIQFNNSKDSNRFKQKRRRQSRCSLSSGPSILSFDSNSSFLSRVPSQKFPQSKSLIQSFRSLTPEKQHQDKKESIAGEITKYSFLIKSADSKMERGNLYFRLGDLYGQNKNYEMSLNMLKNSYECGHFEAAQKIGEIFYIKKSYKEAIQFYEKYMHRSQNKFGPVAVKLIHCYSKISEMSSKGIDKAKQFLEKEPGNFQVHSLLVTMYFRQKNYDKALELCTQFKRKYFFNSDNHHILGLIYKASKNYKLAYQSFLNALRIRPNALKSLIQLGQLTNTHNFYEELLQIFRSALLKTESKPEIFQILKILMEKKSLKNLKITQKLTFSQLIAHGDFFADCQLIKEAELCYLEARKYSNNNLIRQKLGNIAYYRGQYGKAYELFTQSQLRKPSPSIQLKIAQIKIKQKQYSQAKKIIKAWMEKEPSNLGLSRHNLGVCQYHLRNYVEALNHFKKSLNYGYSPQVNNNWINECYGRIHKNCPKFLRKEKQEGNDGIIVKRLSKRNTIKINGYEPIESLYIQKS